MDKEERRGNNIKVDEARGKIIPYEATVLQEKAYNTI